MRITRRALADGEVMPRWYAVAYRDDYREVFWCYPVGIHLVVQLWEWLCWKTARAKHYTLMRRPIRTAYHAGYERACREIDEERIREILYGHLQSMKKDNRP
jgi:hypothetical protein